MIDETTVTGEEQAQPGQEAGAAPPPPAENGRMVYRDGWITRLGQRLCGGGR